MSWFASGVVVNGDTTALEDFFNKVDPEPNESSRDQFNFALEVITNAFDAEIVEGAYSVSCSGHSNPDAENDRKSFSLSFSAITDPAGGIS